MISLFLWYFLGISIIFPYFQDLSFWWNSSSLTFIPPGEIQETLIPTTIDLIHSYYSPHWISLEQNKERYEKMTNSGFRCELHEVEPREDLENPDDKYVFADWNTPYTYVNCFQIPIFLKSYYLPNWELKITEPVIEDWWSRQYDPQRKWSLIASGNFLYSLIYDSNHPEKQEFSDHTGKAFAFFFMVRYRDVPPYEQIEEFIREWSKLAYPKENPAQFIIRENGNSKGAKSFEVYTKYKKENAKQKLNQLFHYFVWCSSEKKQCLVYANNNLVPVLWGIRTDYFGEISPFSGW